MKNFKKVIAVVAVCLMIVAIPLLFTGCKNTSDVNLRVLGEYVQWQEKGDDEWTNLLTIDEIKKILGESYKGDTGAQGEQGIPGEKGAQGDPGINGREVEFRKSTTHIQWRYVEASQGEDENWENLVALSELQGDAGVDGREVEFRKTLTHIQWRYVDDSQGDDENWTDLVQLSSLKGDSGASGPSGNTPYIGADGDWWIGETDTQVKAEAQDGHTPVIEISSDGYWVIDGVEQSVRAVGEKGAQGDPGSEGAKGETGLSAYEIYVKHKHNYKKSEIEWMNDFIEGKLLGLADNLGDVDGNGKVDIGDVTYIRNYLNGTLLVDTNIYNGDIDADGKITEADAYLFQAYLAVKSNHPEITIPFDYLMGDVNLDGQVTESDYLLVKDNFDQLSELQKILANVDYSAKDQIGDDLIIFNAYLDGEIPTLNDKYCVVRFDYGYLEYVPTGYVEMMIVKSGQPIVELPVLKDLIMITFEGWYHNEEEFIENETIVENGMTLTARYDS